MKLNACLFGTILLIISSSCQDEKPISDTDDRIGSNEKTQMPKNIILMIGDGMGVAQISTMIYYKKDNVHFERFPYVGFIKTSASSHKVTDSAAGATAMASGVKTYNAAIGVDKDTVAVPTILEMASEMGKATGLVATSSITHATPACFFAHQPFRNMEEAIAKDMLKAPVDIFMGGGLQFFNKREDGLNLLDSLKANGFSVYTSAFPAKQEDAKVAYFVAENGAARFDQGRGDFLPDASRYAIEKLDEREAGFFLMVEGSQIDWGGHANDSSYVVSEMLDFDNTIGAVLDYAEKDGNTLVIVTADHETGGLSLPAIDKDNIGLSFSTGSHTGIMVPVFAFGPGAEEFSGIYENTMIFEKMRALMGQQEE